MTPRRSTLLGRLALGLLPTGLALVGSTAPASADTLEVWLDDAQTRRIEVEELDPDEIADPSSFGLGFGTSLGQVGISFGWSRETGVQYDKAIEKLIGKIRKLCEEFNEGGMSLETYQRRLRHLYTTIDSARLARVELQAHNAIAANEMGSKLDQAVGLPPADTEAFRKKITGALDAFRTIVESVPPEEPPALEVQGLTAPSDSPSLDRSRAAVEARMSELNANLESVGRRELRDRETITIWADEAHTKQIRVPKLDVDDLCDDLSQSLSVQMKYSAPLFSQYVGPELTYTLECKAKYDESAQLLLVKYRRLCLEYNSLLLSQEGYNARLLALIEAEKRAFAAREELAEELDERAKRMRENLDELLGDRADPLGSTLGDLKDRKRQGAQDKLKEREPGSQVEEFSRRHRSEMAAWQSFGEAVESLPIEPPGEWIEVWIDDARTRQAKVPPLDPEMIAHSVRTRLSLHISFFDFGPECAWAQERGIDYGRVAQELIVKSKALCMEYNAGLVSQESYLRRSRQIDASVEKAAEVRDALIDFLIELKSAARDRLDRQLDLQGRRSNKRGG